MKLSINMKKLSNYDEGMKEYQAGNYHVAYKLLKKAALEDESNPDKNFYAGLCGYQVGSPDAKGFLVKAYELCPSNGKYAKWAKIGQKTKDMKHNGLIHTLMKGIGTIIYWILLAIFLFIIFVFSLIILISYRSWIGYYPIKILLPLFFS